MMPCVLIVDQYGGGNVGMGACFSSIFSVGICLLSGCLNVTKWCWLMLTAGRNTDNLLVKRKLMRKSYGHGVLSCF